MQTFAQDTKTFNITMTSGKTTHIDPRSDIKPFLGIGATVNGNKAYELTGPDPSGLSVLAIEVRDTWGDLQGYTFDIRAISKGTYVLTTSGTHRVYSSKPWSSWKAVYYITVVDVESITLPSTLTLQKYQQYTFNPGINHPNAQTALQWKSLNTSVAEISSAGVVTAKQVGSAIITCTAENGVSASCTVTVTPVTANDLVLNYDEYELELGKKVLLEATVYPEGTENKNVTWKSGDESVAVVNSNGSVTGLGLGYANITATTKDGTNIQANCIVHVVKPVVLAKSIALDQPTATITVGQTAQLIANIEPSDVTNDGIRWKSSNPDYVNVDDYGIIKGVAEGTATITATTTDGTELSATCIVDVLRTILDESDNTIYADNTDVQPGGQMVLPVKMKSAEAITGYQFDLVLPDGFSVAEEDGDYLIELSSRTTYKKHSISYQDQADGSIRIVCTSLNNATFAELDGVVANITLNVDESVEAGDYNIIYKNIELATPALNKYKVAKWSSKVTVFDYILGDVNNDKDVSVVDAAATVNLILGVNTAGLNRKAADIDADGEISVTDAAGVVNIILSQGASVKSAPAKTRLTATADNTLTLSDFTAEAGTQQTISVGMNNTASITGIQFDLVLPEGVTVAQEDGDYLIDISTDRTTYKNHSASYQMQADGSMRVVCTSLSNKTFKENSGNVIDITLDIASSISGGSHTITLKNIELATPELEKYKPSAVSATMTVSGGAYNYIAVDNGGNNVNKSVASGDDVTINDTYQSLSVTEDIDNVNVTYSRTYKNTSWQAWYVPFGFTLTSDIASRFSFAKFAGTYTEAGQFFITLVEMQEGDEIKGNVPYFVQAKVADSSNPQVLNISNTTLYATDASGFKMLSAEKEIAIYGTYAKKVAAADDDWYAYGGGKYIKATTGQSLGAFRFYLTIRDREDNPYASTPNPIEIKVIVLGDEADGISSLNENDSENGTMFNLAGQPVGADYKGVVIRNGKKTFIH